MKIANLNLYNIFFLFLSSVPGGSTVLYLSIPGWILSGRAFHLYAFILGGWFSSFVNPYLAQNIELDALAKWIPLFSLLFFACYLTVQKKTLKAPVIWITVFFLWVILASFFSSKSFIISSFKGFSFFAFVASSIVVFSTPRDGWARKEFYLLFEVFYKFLIITSFLVLVAGLGYERNGHGFQGIIQHPQAFGIILAPLVVGMVALNLEKLRTGDLRMVVWVGIGFAFIIMTASRTAMLSLAAGLAVLGLIFFKRNVRRSLVYGALVFPIVFFAFLIVQLDHGSKESFDRKVNEVIFKGYDASSLGEGFYLSRGYILDDSFRNIADNLILGIGFGIPSDGDLSGTVYDPIFGLPISLTVEKGVAFIALLEEVGLPGFVLFFCFMLSLWKAMKESGRPIFSIPIFVSILAANIGEAVLFSVGGVGFFHWLIISGLLLKDAEQRGGA